MLARIVKRQVVAMLVWARCGFYKDNRGKDQRNSLRGTKEDKAGTWSRYNSNEFKSYFDPKVSLLDK